MTQLGTYYVMTASICIAIPPPGEDFSRYGDPKPVNSQITKRTATRKITTLTDNWIWSQPDDVTVAIATLQFYVISNLTKVVFWAGQSRVPSELLLPGKHILSYEQGTSPDNVSMQPYNIFATELSILKV